MRYFIGSIVCSVSLVVLGGGCELVPFGNRVPATQPIKYPIPYVVPTTQSVVQALGSMRVVLDGRMVMSVNDPQTAAVIKYPANLAGKVPAKETAFGLTGYPSGVIYAAMISAGEATGDKAFFDFDADRFQYFADNEPKFEHAHLKAAKNPFHSWTRPDSLDACGAMGAAFVKARRADVGPDLQILIDRFANFVSKKQYRLADRTVARHRPFKSCLWLDDMYMSVPFLAQMGALTGDAKYYDDAAKQVIQLSARLFNPATGLYTHGCDLEAPDAQPTYYWGRANGWAIMAMCELLDVLPENHPQRAAILKLLQAHAKGLASVQSGQGLWHQMLDRPDTYLETSCSAMFTYSIAHAVNRGWLNANIYGPVALIGWDALTTRMDAKGQLTGTCVGTSYAADYVYYYARPAADDPHGYGPTIMAGSEIIRLLKNPKFVLQSGNNRPLMLLDKRAPMPPTPTEQGDMDSDTDAAGATTAATKELN